ncbi:MAG: YkgJ family cysteine cluster protein [Deltaproteobacteria bacterium]|nr:YkgJ family cysteine cluster protein [Deltaproteobacteria bacterium]
MADDDRYVTRADFERTLRHLNLADLDVRNLVLKLAAQVVALTDELTRRMPPAENAEPENAATVEAAVDDSIGDNFLDIRAADDGASRVALDISGGDKYAAVAVAIPCAELIPLCQGRCCKLHFALSTQDLDEGLIRFDYGKPYTIRQRSSDGYCVHSDPTTRACTTHAVRPQICRTYDCREDNRIWIDFEKRIPAPFDVRFQGDAVKLDRYERARLRGLAVWREQSAIDDSYPDGVPKNKEG